MKTILPPPLRAVFFCAVTAAAIVLLPGCDSVPGIVHAASTKLTVKDASGHEFTATFPKELTSQNFALTLDPQTGKVTVTADNIQTSSSQLVNSAGGAQAQALLAMSQTIAQLAPIAQAAAGQPAAAAAVSK